MPPEVAWCRSVNLDHDFHTCARWLDKIVACGDSGVSGWAGFCGELMLGGHSLRQSKGTTRQ